MANELLNELNAFRIDRDLAPFADWRKARHMPLLEQYRLERAAFDAAYVAGGKAADAFEASEAELAAQALRPSTETFTAKIENVEFVETNHGVKLTVVELVDVKPVTTEEAPAAPAKMKSYKQVANYNKSSIESPVAFIHAFLSANPTLSRKAAVIALTSEHGINYSTARTQYQRWFTANKAAK